MFRGWINEAGGGEFEDIHYAENEALSSVDTNDPWWNAVQGRFKSMLPLSDLLNIYSYNLVMCVILPSVIRVCI